MLSPARAISGIFRQFQPQQQLQPLFSTGKEISYAGSSYYDKWNLRPYNPAELYQKKGNYDLYDDIREDDQVKAVLTLKKLMVLNSEWIIETEEEEVKNFLTECLNDHLEGLFVKKLFDMLSCLDYGWSITEKIWDIKDTNFGQKIILKNLKTRAPHMFDLYTDDYGNLDKIIQHINQGELDLDPPKFIIYSYNKEFDNWYGNSEINKGIYRAWWSKNAIIKFWNIYLERFGMPTHKGKIPRAAGEADKNVFIKMLKNIQSKTALTIPEGFEIELLQVAASRTTEYESAINRYDTMIARSVLVPDLIGISGSQTSGGSYALGKEQFNIFYTVIAYIRNDIERLINKEIIAPLILWNYGSKTEAKFKFNAIDEERKKSDLTLWLESVKTGKIPVYGDHINWLLEQVNAPLIDQDKLDLLDEQKDKMREQITQEQPIQEKQENNVIPIKQKEQQEKQFIKDVIRPLTQYEKKVNFNKIENRWDDLTEKYKKELGGAYSLIINSLIDDVRAKKILENKKLVEVNKLRLKYLQKTSKLWRDLLKDSMSAAQEDIRKFAVEQASGLDDEDIAEWITANANYINIAEAAEILKKAKGVIIDGIRNGIGVQQMIKQLSKVLDPWDVEQLTVDKNGNPLNLKARLETIIRTNINKAYNQARQTQFESVADEITAYQFSAIMDGRTSDICISLDGKVFKQSELGYYNPPLHYNCRSMIIPIYKDEKFYGVNTDIPATQETYGGFIELV